MLIKRVSGIHVLAGLWAVLTLATGLSVEAQTISSPADRDAAARAAYARGDNARASATLNEAVRLNPFDPVALNNLAVNYAAQGDYQNAIALNLEILSCHHLPMECQYPLTSINHKFGWHLVQKLRLDIL